MDQYLVMYDVRGIQNFIFRTPKVKDAIGASFLIENIFHKALEYAVERLDLSASLEYAPEDGKFNDKATDAVQVLYIGGGNAFALIGSDQSDDEAMKRTIAVNKKMAKYVMDNTYSLQLATAFVKKTGNYAEDYNKLFEKMIKVKATMNVSAPLGALPIMKTELKTGYPVSAKYDGEFVSMETKMKKEAGKDAQDEADIELNNQIFDNLVEEKGVNSTLAVVHIDGNNMGMRIRDLVQDATTYQVAVSKMRAISHAISKTFSDAFSKMNEEYNGLAEKTKGEKGKYFIRKILVAGDDITYVCTGKIALDTIEFFAKEVAEKTLVDFLTEDTNVQNEKEKYKFSICAGAALMGSHFPFDVAYDVAEACCESAKERAKKKENLEDGQVGNWVDFAFCDSVYARDLKAMREREYITPTGEHLLTRPYRINVNDTVTVEKKEFELDTLKSYIEYFLGTDEEGNDNFPRSLAKDLRNTYPVGWMEMEALKSFMDSRQHILPDGNDLYFDNKGHRIARYYDALEMMDYYENLSSGFQNKEDGEEVS